MTVCAVTGENPGRVADELLVQTVIA